MIHDPSKAIHWNGKNWVEHDFLLPKVDTPSLAELRHLIFGASDQGTNERADVIFQTLDGTDLAQMWRDFNATLAIYNEQRDRLTSFFTYPVTTLIEMVRYPTAENFELASEYGEPVGIRLSTPFPMSYDFKWYDLAIRYTWQFLIESTAAQIDALHNEALEADDRLVFTKVLRTIFNPTNVTSSVRNFNVPVYKFYNADGMVPPTYKTTSFDGTHNHYLTSGASSIATAAITAIEDTLYHHGYSQVNGYQMVLLVNRQEGKILRGARVTGSWGYDFIPGPAYGGRIFLPASLGIAGSLEAAPSNLNALQRQEIGTYGPFHVIEEDYIPAGYVVALVSAGPQALGNPIGIRQHENASASGLKLIPGDNTYPLKDSFYRHGFGSGIRHRGAGVVMQITTAGSYTAPAAYV